MALPGDSPVHAAAAIAGKASALQSRRSGPVCAPAEAEAAPVAADLWAESAHDRATHRTLPGGSDAKTVLEEVDGVLVIRKTARGAAAEKLRQQVAWLFRHGADLPLTPILAQCARDKFCSYDMPYRETARDFYDVIRTQPIPDSLIVLREIFERVRSFHAKYAGNPAPEAVVDRYLAEKVALSSRAIVAYARALIGHDDYFINGERYALREWWRLADLDWLRDQVRCRLTSVIHGDLTIENVIVDRSGPAPGWYIIDPNPENIFNTPLIDWAKMMQSLRLGYESLNRNGVAKVADNRLDVPFSKSFAYTEMLLFFDSLLQRHLDEEQLREVAFHELVNYLRLTLYKLRGAPDKAPTFFACSSVLLRRYVLSRQRTAAARETGLRHAAQ